MSEQYALPEESGLTMRRWPGVYPGTVVATATDPKKRGYLRVRVDQVYGVASDPDDEKIPDGSLPWAAPSWPFVGPDVGCLAVPPVGAGVWVAFWAGNPTSPVWLGGFLGDGDSPARWASAYKGAVGPCTRLVRTPTGHVFEMRWCEGEEEVLIETAGGVRARLIDAQALGGPEVSVETPAGQRVDMTDRPPKVSVTSSGDVDVSAAGRTTQNYGTASAIAFAAALLLTVGGAGLTLAVTALAFTGAVAITAAGAVGVTASAITLTGAVFLGIAGTKYRLVDERFLSAVQNANVATFNGHTHPDPVSGNTGPPSSTFVPGTPGTHTTQNTVAN